MAHDLLIGTYTQRLPHVDGHADGVLSARFDGTGVVDVAVAAEVPNPSWVAASADTATHEGFGTRAATATSTTAVPSNSAASTPSA